MTPDRPERFADAAERYRLDSRIATGGMGEVWRASDTRLGRTVAVKLLKPEYADDATFRTRFTSEAQHAAALHHPGVAAVYDYGGSDSTPYLVMELVDGQPLSALIAPDRPMDPEVVRDLMAQAADAIGAAHAAGIVHRDVKPANLLVTPDRRIKITDFGIARAAEGMALTQTGQVMGTPQYLSPEQAQGGTATPASDVYSLGVVAYECLVGRRPFVGETPVATALAHLREPVPELPPEVPSDLAAVVRRAMSKDPADRFADASALAAAFRDPATVAMGPAAAAGPATQVMTGTAAAPVPPPAGPPTDPQRSRRSPWPWILLALVVIAAIVVVWLLATADEEPTSDQSPNRGKQSSQAGSPTPEESTPPPETSAPPPEETTSQEPETFDINEDDYLGRDVSDVEDELRSLGLEPTSEEIDNDGTQQEDTVASVSPTSGLQEGDPVVIEYYGPPVDTSGPPETPPGQEKKNEEDQQ